MRESVLRDYFLGVVDESRLSEDLAGSAVKTSYDVITHYVTDDFAGDFEVKSIHLIRLCDAFLTGKLKAEHLELSDLRGSVRHFLGITIVTKLKILRLPKQFTLGHRRKSTIR
jgi:hypothetical protein